MNTHTHSARNAFTLIELVLVIAIIAIISSLAIPRLSGIQERSKRKANLANMVRVSHYIDTFLAANSGAGLNRLDALLEYDADSAAGGVANYTASTNGALVFLDSALTASRSFYGGGGVALLGVYHIDANEAAALHKLGLKYSMRRANPAGGFGSSGDDNEWAQNTGISDPDLCCTFASALTNNSPVMIVNPGAIDPVTGRSPTGAFIYQSCGQSVRYSTSAKIYIDDDNTNGYSDNSDAIRALRNGSGVLLAFGLGDKASCIGNNVAGLDSAPVCTEATDGIYRRYILLIRLRGTGAATVAEFAGIMDPLGRPLKDVRTGAEN